MKAKRNNDAFGRQIWDCFNGKDNVLLIERDDGLTEVSAGNFYFIKSEQWSKNEIIAVGFAKGKILDIGCGPGRHALYLQEKGLDVTAMDPSPLAIRVCKMQGIKKSLIGQIENINDSLDLKYDTFLLMGNNLGLLQNQIKAPEILRRLHGAGSDNAIIIAESSNPDKIYDPAYRSYFNCNLKKGKLSGEVKLRVRYDDITGPWFEYLYLSPSELEQLIRPTGWKILKIFENNSPQYFVILGKC
ncbi:MAG: methyltransferase domain-containing protein [Patescibacteria group bacterium]